MSLMAKSEHMTMTSFFDNISALIMTISVLSEIFFFWSIVLNCFVKTMEIDKDAKDRMCFGILYHYINTVP